MNKHCFSGNADTIQPFAMAPYPDPDLIPMDSVDFDVDDSEGKSSNKGQEPIRVFE